MSQQAQAASSSMTPEEVGRRAGQIRDDLRSGKLTLAVLGAGPLTVIAGYGLTIPEQNRPGLLEHIGRLASTKVELCGADRPAEALGSSNCTACDIGLGVALAALALLTVAAVAVAVVIFSDGLAAPAVIAFLESQVVFPIFLGVLIAGTAALGAYICSNLIKC